MLPHKTGKLTVFSVELQNADPVLDLLWKHFTSGQPVIYKLKNLHFDAFMYFYIQIRDRSRWI